MPVALELGKRNEAATAHPTPDVLVGPLLPGPAFAEFDGEIGGQDVGLEVALIEHRPQRVARTAKDQGAPRVGRTVADIPRLRPGGEDGPFFAEVNVVSAKEVIGEGFEAVLNE